MAEPTALATLVDQLEGNARERDQATRALGLATGDYPRLPALEEFRRVHAQLRARQQLQASLQPPPAGAGPLNSASLAHRALELMRETSPGYLRHFVDYLDTLSWLQAAQAGVGRNEGKQAGRAAEPARTRARKTSRRRKPGA